MGKSTISMAIFNSYVSLPEGMWLLRWFYMEVSENGG
jgi:DNA-directed RNA polymerase specialized sigma54-like protein